MIKSAIPPKYAHKIKKSNKMNCATNVISNENSKNLALRLFVKYVAMVIHLQKGNRKMLEMGYKLFS